ncbi:hypothetical protein V6N13_006296 [Hibiscus sabdariffa]
MCSVLKLDDGQWCSNQSIIRQKVVEFFKKVFSASSITGWDFHGCFPSLLTCDVMRRTDAMRRTAAIGDDEVTAFVTDAGDWDMEALRLVLPDDIVDHVLTVMPPRVGNGSDNIG